MPKLRWIFPNSKNHVLTIPRKAEYSSMLEFLQLPRIIDLQSTPGFERWALADNAGRRPFLLGLFRGQPTKVAFLEENHGLTLPVLTANG